MGFVPTNDNGMMIRRPSLLCSGEQTTIHSRIYQRQSSLGMASTQQQQNNDYRPYTQVISDVDDTLKSSGGVTVAGVALGGIDIQYTRGEFYPGVFQFMLELSMPTLDNDDDENDTENEKSQFLYPPKVAVLTARAEEFKVALELKGNSKLAKAFRKTGEKAGIDDWGLGPVLYGSVAEWVIQDRKGMRKFSNFERLIEQDPTGTIMQYVYVGDTGELDQEAGETMLREYPEVVKAVFLHVVSDAPFPRVPPPKLINGRPVVFFRTYVGAAARAVQLGLMQEEGLMRVIVEAEAALKGVPTSNEKWLDLERDISEAYRTLSVDL
eukprot:CAMPEP_0185731864 /NCGR_PEP_ID=MMETSP1171-20130828/14126_1 /TAXON_ID=374046 /ORGANISM="Helicotheca tamensis, Strain CCMP826" /LENGTH=323 /DNA_ID=CAMNT_0028401215 /DNA_START=168 /DNA_END=1139 /DNA_ORIENTATION=+